jgi:hypothetical protein
VQFNLENTWYDYFSLSIFFPYFEVEKIHEDLDEQNNTYSFNAPTTISLVKSKIHVGLKLQFLGFGFGLLRQNSY